ncbi:MAG: alpha/beta hydrolase [Ktedonobacterales bacterium]
MDVSHVAPELRGPMRRVTLLPLPTARGWRLRVVRALLAVVPSGKLEGVTIEQSRTTGATATDAPQVRVYRPAVRRSAAALFWIHGGGLIIGRAVQDDHLCALTARELGILVVSVEYRTAPEHPFPAALDDCLAGWTWLQREAERLGVDPTRIALGGASAGGGLAASLAQRLHDATTRANGDAEAGVAVPVAQWLFCPMLDDRTAARGELDSVNHFVWNNRLNRFGWRSYLGVEPGANSVPAYAVPSRREDLHGLPSAWIGVGDIELFYNEDCDYAQRLRAAGVEVTLDIVAGAPHGFEAWASNTALARDYIGRAQAWLRQAIRAREGSDGA